jgi:hypothetical protein
MSPERARRQTIRLAAGGVLTVAMFLIGAVLAFGAGPAFTASELPLASNAVASPGVAVPSLSCTSAGNCVTVGNYQSTGGATAMAQTESNGVWGAPVALGVPSHAVGDVEMLSVSCKGVGDCAAVGYYTDTSGQEDVAAFTETNGTWGAPVQVQVPSNAIAHDGASLNGVSCTSVGNCVAVGAYEDTSGGVQAMIATETNGVWGQADEVISDLPVNAAPPDGEDAALVAITCLSAGNCVATGHYRVNVNSMQAMVETETNGTWNQATEITQPSNPNSEVQDTPAAVSCSSASNCTIVGQYLTDNNQNEAMVATETAGSWSPLTELSLPSNASTGTSPGSQLADLNGVSCTAAGSCIAVGDYTDGSGASQVMTAAEANGSWGAGAELALPTNTDTATGRQSADLNGIACVSAGSCTAVGEYRNSSANLVGLVASSGAPALSVTTASLPSAVGGKAYHAQLSATGGTGRYTWSVRSGSLPRGLHLNASTGAISGMPARIQTSTFTVGVSDPGPPPQTATKSLKITVKRPPKPHTIITHAKVSSHARSAKFSFTAHGDVTGYQCALVRAHGPHSTFASPRYGACRSPKSYRHLGAGRYRFTVRAVGLGGADPRPPSHTFTIA